jgi:hypothetical protein
VILIEQSVIDKDTPLRLLFFIKNLCASIIMDSQDGCLKEFPKLPRPEIFVLYNGKDDLPDIKMLNLSEAYKRHSSPFLIGYTADSKIMIMNLNKGCNEKLIGRNADLCEYVTDVRKSAPTTVEDCMANIRKSSAFIHLKGTETMEITIKFDKAMTYDVIHALSAELTLPVEKLMNIAAERLISDINFVRDLRILNEKLE